MISKYLAEVQKQYNTENATEHSYRGALQELVSSIIDDEKVTVVNEPKRSECGAPDYIISKKVQSKGKDSIPLGFIEAKDIGKDLKSKNYKEQFTRYKKGLENLIITDYLTFEFYKKQDKTQAELYETCTIAELLDGKIQPREEEFDKFANLIRDFVTFVGQTIKSPASLAAMMAGKAKMLAEVIRKAIESDEENLANSSLKDQMQAFKKILIHDISPAAFADVYAQTITYGMFAARLHDKTLDDFSRQEAATLIPKTNPFLRNLFQYVSGYDVDDRILWIVDSLADIFVYTDIKELLKNFGRATKTHDPIIHFYETFLAEYDPKLRKARGVWYTPEPVVNFIVRAVDDILKTEFGLPDGLADTSKTKIKVPVQGKKTLVDREVHKVQILDPATGTGTFLAEVVRRIYRKFVGMEGMWSDYVEKDLIPRLNGFEILMASYAMAHLKLELLLRETGYEPNNPDRFHVYLTNSLEEAHPDTGTLFASWLSNEATAANLVKMEAPVMVVLGNPPYSGESSNKGKWIMDLMKDYKKEPGGKEKLKERNPKWINADENKFIRYGQYHIEKNGEGILAFINPHGFLDSPTLRGMRWNLLKTYDKIYIIDLHGNSKKKEACPDGTPDINVFDIMQGVSINLLVKTGKKKKNDLGQVFHYDLFGKRELKYDFLRDKSLSLVDFVKIPNKAPQYFMVQKDFDIEEEYEKGFSINALFPVNNVGIVTSRDSLVIDMQKEMLEKRIENFFTLEKSEIIKNYGVKENKSWKINEVKNKVKKIERNELHRVLYRPFENRWLYYNEYFIERSRSELMRHFLQEDNVGLIIPKQVPEKENLGAFITKTIAGHKTCSAYNINNIFPLYLYFGTTSQQSTIEKSEKRVPNLNSEVMKDVSKNISLKFTPEKENTKDSFAPIDLLDYIYAILHSPTYREKYKEFLKIDFPRVPYPKDATKFWELVKLGGEIRELHLMESAKLEDSVASYPKSGSNEITRKLGKKDWELYDEKSGIGRIWINDEQYFDKIPLIAWEFYIGGYQPAQKWLKDRQGRTLNLDDIRHYLKIIVALVETDRLMKEIDKVGVE
jgi:predicted helicase